MGNRATIEIKDGSGYKSACYIYLHWCGDPEQVTEMVTLAAPVMRRSDSSYATARLIGMYHDAIEGGLSLGVTDFKEEWDNGHYIVDMAEGTIFNEGETIASGIEFGNF